MVFEIILPFEFVPTHFTRESWWYGGVLITDVLSEVTFHSKLLPTILALMVAHLQMDTAEVIVQCLTLKEPLVTCVAEMFGLPLILTVTIVSS